MLTRAGRDLIAAVKPDFVIEAIATCFAKGGQASAMHELQSNVGDTETSYTKLRDLSYLIPESK